MISLAGGEPGGFNPSPPASISPPRALAIRPSFCAAILRPQSSAVPKPVFLIASHVCPVHGRLPPNELAIPPAPEYTDIVD